MTRAHDLPIEVVEMILKDIFQFKWSSETQQQIQALALVCPSWIPIMVQHVRRKTLLRDTHGLIRDDALSARFQTLFYLRERQCIEAGQQALSGKMPEADNAAKTTEMSQIKAWRADELADMASSALELMDRDRIREAMSVRNFTRLAMSPMDVSRQLRL